MERSAAGDAVPYLVGMQPIFRAPQETDVRGQMWQGRWQAGFQGGNIFASVNRNSNEPGFLTCSWQREQEGEEGGGWCSGIPSLLVWQLREGFIL